MCAYNNSFMTVIPSNHRNQNPLGSLHAEKIAEAIFIRLYSQHCLGERLNGNEIFSWKKFLAIMQGLF